MIAHSLAGADRVLVAVDDLFCEMIGAEQREIVGRDVLAFTHPDDNARNATQLRKLGHDGEPFDLRKRYVRIDGTILWVEVAVSTLLDGSTPKLVATTRALSATEAAEAHRTMAIRRVTWPVQPGNHARAAARARAVGLLRDRARTYIAAELLGDPAYDLLVYLAAIYDRHRSIEISALCGAIHISVSIGVRWIAELERKGLVRVHTAENDPSRALVSLSPGGADVMAEYLLDSEFMVEEPKGERHGGTQGE